MAEAWDEPAAEPGVRLEALIGPQRARILRELERPQSVGVLAKALIAVPSAATHHVSALEAAGLIVRERHGRRVIVHRTPRGSHLVALYEEPALTASAR